MGEPEAGRSDSRYHRVYPRVCGGTPRWPRRWRPARGLSPRVRGNPYPGCPLNNYGSPGTRGSIPACAGEPPPAMYTTWSFGVYPRVCGGTRRHMTNNGEAYGLSPRVRGNRLIFSPAGGLTGSIPACAGEPIDLFARRRIDGVYPRVCGGTLPLPLERRLGIGLSPRVRGNLAAAPGASPGHRSIPACAGEPRRNQECL